MESNMTVMTNGFERVQEVPYGPVDASDFSSMRFAPLKPKGGADYKYNSTPTPKNQPAKHPIATTEFFDKEFRAGLGYHQPASALASVGVTAAATGVTASKYVARRMIPKYKAENCTQCMECIAGCPDTALPNTAQDLSTVMRTAIKNYVSDGNDMKVLLDKVPEMEANLRAQMKTAVENKEEQPFKELFKAEAAKLLDVSETSREELAGIVEILPIAYTKVNAIFKTPEKKKEGETTSSMIIDNQF